MIKFCAYDTSIIEFEVIRETKKFIVFISKDGEEESDVKMSKHGYWFDTKQQAKDYLIKMQNYKIRRANSIISCARNCIEEIEEL